MSDTEPEIDPAVKKITVDGETVERDPRYSHESEDRVAAKAAMRRADRGLMITKLKFPGARGC